jgi:hypothetical protein
LILSLMLSLQNMLLAKMQILVNSFIHFIKHSKKSAKEILIHLKMPKIEEKLNFLKNKYLYLLFDSFKINIK